MATLHPIVFVLVYHPRPHGSEAARIGSVDRPGTEYGHRLGDHEVAIGAVKPGVGLVLSSREAVSTRRLSSATADWSCSVSPKLTQISPI